MLGSRPVFFALCTAFALSACARPTPGSPSRPQASLDEALVAQATTDGQHHPHSLSNPEEVKVLHMGISLDVDFQSQTIKGTVRYLVDRPSPNAPLVLDTKGLKVTAAFISDGPEDLQAFQSKPALAEKMPNMSWRPAKWSLGSQDPLLGRPLAIPLGEHTKVVEIQYLTTKDSIGLQWLSPAQTDDGKRPFLYTQSQPILGRSFIPMQDTPAIRVTYDAQISVPEDLRALMAAQALEQPPKKLPPVSAQGKRTFHFSMPQPVPSYLIALAVGRLNYASLGKQSGVWASPSTLAAARYEMQPIEDMIKKTESLFGPYRWGRYDVLVLPAAFPYGGMENPRLTFATPTILAKDRSLISLIAHELAHSWSGNLVTNANWNDIWLNEGFTTYAERRIVEAVYGPERAEMEALLGYQDLQRTLTALKDSPNDQRLAADASGRDPDILLSNIAYEKGALFLRRLEQAYGRATFDAFLRRWFDKHAFQAVSTPQFLAFLQQELIETAKLAPGQKPVKISAWLDKPGLPDDAPIPKSQAFAQVDAAYLAFAKGSLSLSALAFPRWTVQEKLHFLRRIDAQIDDQRFAQLDQRFGLTGSKNSELLAEWLTLAARRGYTPAKGSILSFLTKVGRRKFLVPIYTALIAGPFGRQFAQEVFEGAKSGYHAISRDTVAALLATPAADPTK